MGWSFTEVEIVAGLFAVTGLVLLGTLHFIVRSSPPAPVDAPPATRPNPSPLELVREEGFQVIELYEDAVPFGPPPGTGAAGDFRALVRTAKVLDPESGQVRLLRVLIRHPARH